MNLKKEISEKQQQLKAKRLAGVVNMQMFLSLSNNSTPHPHPPQRKKQNKKHFDLQYSQNRLDFFFFTS